jgi:murein DD-endopeptidase MepM/ murein hydrolase activator NlpD
LGTREKRIMGREKGWRIAARWIYCFVSDNRKLLCTVIACMFVPAVVLLCLDRNPFPRPFEKMLYSPTGWPGGWPALFRGDAPSPGAVADVHGLQQGGGSYSVTPLSIMRYKVKTGDTLERIASRFAMELDTLSSLNRPGGRGVHNLTVGEEILIPNQDGIYVAVNGDFEAICRKYGLAPQDVLAANSIAGPEPVKGTPVFFPGAMHQGYELSLSYGVAIASPLHGWLSSPFGYREDPFTGAPSRHRGIDIAAPEGNVVRSASDGVVSAASYSDVLGNFVEVRSPLGFRYIYGHFSVILTRTGARVSQGSPLGRVGSTGHATGPHLHFEVWKDGVLQNPLKYLPGVR